MKGFQNVSKLNERQNAEKGKSSLELRDRQIFTRQIQSFSDRFLGMLLNMEGIANKDLIEKELKLRHKGKLKINF